MNRLIVFIAIIFHSFTLADAQNSVVRDSSSIADEAAFHKWMQVPAKLVFSDDLTHNWTDKWFLDGGKGRIVQSKAGMDFFAGDSPRSDSDHVVLWTKLSFEGKLRIEYDFTRLDTVPRFVNILYLFAEGSGVTPYQKDIFEWKQLRQVPAMSLYFEHMNAYHISYAAFDNSNNDPLNDYVRARRYLPERGKGLKGTEMKPDYSRSGLFAYGVLHHVSVIYTGNDIYFKVTSAQITKLFHWDTRQLPLILSGRIGLRLMCVRASRFANFKVYTL